MYGNRDNEYFREALNDPNSHLYKKICQSGPVVTFRLLTSESFDLRGGLIVHRVEPIAYDWSKLTKTNNGSLSFTSVVQQQQQIKDDGPKGSQSTIQTL